MLFLTLLFGLAGAGAVLMYGDDFRSFLGGGSKQLPQAARKKDVLRSAPYVTLVPAETLPETSEPARPKPQAAPAPVTDPARPDKSAERPKEPGTPPGKELSPIARQVLDVVGEKPAEARPVKKPVSQPEHDKPPKTLVAAPPKPVAETKPEPDPAPRPVTAKAPQPAPVPEPAAQKTPDPPPESKPVSEKKTVPAPAPAPKPPRAAASQQPVKAEDKRLVLKYESETDLQAKQKEKSQSLLSDEPMRFRRLLPQGSGRLKAKDRTIILAGVEGLPQNQQCAYPSGKTWDCGKWGAFALRRLIRGRAVVCDLIEAVSETEVTGLCSVAGVDINEWVVRRGWARPAEGAAQSYAAAFKAARDDKLGQWSVEPEETP